MILRNVIIKNFRSIRYINFHLSSYVGLVGQNEAGKSNILRALSLLSEDSKTTKDDIRDELPDEDPINESYVWFDFAYSDDEIKEIYENIIIKFPENIDSKKMINFENKGITLLEFLNKKREFLYQVDLINNTRGFSHWSIDSSKFSINENWYEVVDTVPATATIGVNEQKISLKEYEIIYLDKLNEEISKYLKKLKLTVLNSLISEKWLSVEYNSLPKVVIWEYTEANLLPGRINLAGFTANPDICIPLKNMFILAGIDNISEKISLATARTNGMRNLLNRVGKKATEHLRNCWPEKTDINIVLSLNGTIIEAGVEDTFNIYDFSRRSEGFKRFLTFLLLISAATKSNKIKNQMIIIDEPDIGLHPSGSRCLQRELKNISKNNFVIFSTHSIFMIDRDNLGNHFVVIKDKELTTIDVNSKTDFLEEEVLYNSIGFSVFEFIGRKNIIFEGWRDKKLFQVAITKSKKGNTGVQKYFKCIGACFSNGVKDIPRISAILQLANREYLIISDNDKAALNARKRFSQESLWTTYNDYTDDNIVTAEDFIKTEYITPIYNNYLNSNGIKSITQADYLNQSIGILESMRLFLELNNVEKDDQKQIINIVKNDIFDQLTIKNIKDSYFELLKNIKNAIENS